MNGLLVLIKQNNIFKIEVGCSLWMYAVHRNLPYFNDLLHLFIVNCVLSKR